MEKLKIRFMLIVLKYIKTRIGILSNTAKDIIELEEDLKIELNKE